MSNFKHITETNLSNLKREAGWLKGPLMWDGISSKRYQHALAVCKEDNYLRVNVVAINPIKDYTEFNLYVITGGAAGKYLIDREDILAILPSTNIL